VQSPTFLCCRGEENGEFVPGLQWEYKLGGELADGRGEVLRKDPLYALLGENECDRGEVLIGEEAMSRKLLGGVK